MARMHALELLPDDLVRAVLDLRAELPDVQHVGWLPHVTLARRISRDGVPQRLRSSGTATWCCR